MRNYVYQIIRFGLYWPSAAMTGVLGGISKVDPNMLKGHADKLIPIVCFLHGKQWLSLATAIIMATSAVTLKAIGPPWVRDAVKHVLDAMHEHAFGKSTGRELFYDRVTLFRYKPICFRFWKVGVPWGGFLVPYERSGHFFGKPSVVFRVPDDCDAAEGVAGQAYVSGAALSISGLPDVSRRASPTDQDFVNYARKTWVADEWLRVERSTARALLSMRVLVTGKPWGVIVVDTRATTIPDEANVITSYTLVAKVLGELLERS